MKRANEIPLGQKVIWEGKDAEENFGTWNGKVVGTGPDGITVHFEKEFVGHAGISFTSNNEQLTNAPFQNAWYFDYEPAHPAMSGTKELEIVWEPE